MSSTQRRLPPGQAFLWGKEEGLTRFLALLLLVLFVVFPLGATGRTGSLAAAAVDAAVCLTAVSGAWALGWSMRTGVFVSAASLAAFASRRLEASAGPVFGAASSFLFAVVLGTLAVLLLTRVLGEGPVTRRRIEGAIAVYLLVALVASSLHEGILALDPGAVRSGDGKPVTPADLLYLSFVTLTTVGYGDLVPVSAWSRAVSNMESLVGQLYPAILIARLVSLELSTRVDRR